jgi:hypothetical protein
MISSIGRDPRSGLSVVMNAEPDYRLLAIALVRLAKAEIAAEAAETRAA